VPELLPGQDEPSQEEKEAVERLIEEEAGKWVRKKEYQIL
jgi:hypothetical protein